MHLLKKKYYTIEDIYALPPGERAELIDGQIHYMAPPTTTHQRIVHFLDWVIGSYIREHNGSCEVFPAPFAVFLEADEGTYVEPDLTVPMVCPLDGRVKACVYEDLEIDFSGMKISP